MQLCLISCLFIREDKLVGIEHERINMEGRKPVQKNYLPVIKEFYSKQMGMQKDIVNWCLP